MFVLIMMNINSTCNNNYYDNILQILYNDIISLFFHDKYDECRFNNITKTVFDGVFKSINVVFYFRYFSVCGYNLILCFIFILYYVYLYIFFCYIYVVYGYLFCFCLYLMTSSVIVWLDSLHFCYNRAWSVFNLHNVILFLYRILYFYCYLLCSCVDHDECKDECDIRLFILSFIYGAVFPKWPQKR